METVPVRGMSKAKIHVEIVRALSRLFRVELLIGEECAYKTSGIFFQNL